MITSNKIKKGKSTNLYIWEAKRCKAFISVSQKVV
ncbi:hypothetical protein BJP35_2406 [Enterobacter sp. J49]|nr:hypothetical protein BJP35_2406 [Enterobacter sp. J49]